MCTVTVEFKLQDPSSFTVCMNRDESVTRGPEVTPRMILTGIAGPLDSESGGTWIGVNSHGYAACLLNNYGAEQLQERLAVSRGDKSLVAKRSRGLIIPNLLKDVPAVSVPHWLAERFDASEYSPFTLLVVEPSRGIREINWLGRGELIQTDHTPGVHLFTSSSWNTSAVCEWRRKEFQQFLADHHHSQKLDLLGFHRYQPLGMESWAPLMKRPNTSTRSITQVEVDPSHCEVRIHYWAPVEDSNPHRFTLPLAKAPGLLPTTSTNRYSQNQTN
ncbi:MAG: NRDE family protein [Candidatus Sumerlaeia bacterium]|nr:NRDE family protein [Candidatus Sumerlaeia bacterium]